MARQDGSHGPQGGPLGRIRLLPEHVISQIAAGEVIQRPASALKELIENSLDAGADKIEISLEGAGLKNLSIADNGHGMSEEDLRLSIERHATSKIQDTADLFMIRTFGFRGEALASIRAVSRLKISTRAVDSETGYLLSVEGMNDPHIEPIQRRPGTTVEVRDLFFNTPVRRKFLKGPNAEFRYILDWLTRFAFAHPDKRFTVDRDGERILTLERGEGIEERLELLWGEGTAKQLSLIEAEEDGIRLTLYVLSFDRLRNRADRCLFFVNKRPVKDKNIQKALSEALLFAIPKGLYPECLLFLEMDPEELDVNIHPSKEEVRFYETSQVYRLIYRAIEQHLKRPISPMVEGLCVKKEDVVREEEGTYEIPHPLSLRPKTIVDYFHGDQTPVKKAIRIIGRLNQLYILCEAEEGLYIFDQHAVHERLIYERLLSAYTDGKVLRQPLIEPYVFEVSLEEFQELTDHKDDLAAMGIKIAPFGKNCMVLEEIPMILKGMPPSELVAHLLEFKGDMRKTKEDLAHSLISKLACRAAIKAGVELSQFELEGLIQEIISKEVTKSCPHGRPVFRFISYQELEKGFGRS